MLTPLKAKKKKPNSHKDAYLSFHFFFNSEVIKVHLTKAGFDGVLLFYYAFFFLSIKIRLGIV
jgi:hypothetical protein